MVIAEENTSASAHNFTSGSWIAIFILVSAQIVHFRDINELDFEIALD
jgi:hypothetical protein